MTAYIFDVDGVITDPDEKKITKPELIKLLVDKLLLETPMAFITGRGIDWMHKQVLSVLEKYIEEQQMDRSLLDNLFVAGEFGGRYVTYQNGVEKEETSYELVIPQKLRQHLNEVGNTFSDFAEVEYEKKVQFSMEAKKGNNFFGEEGKKIATTLRQEISNYPSLEVHTDRIGMNVRNKADNKHYAVAQFITWLTKKDLHPEKYYVFGDSPSDLEMGEELQNQNMPFDFIYVGEEKDVQDHKQTFSVTVMDTHYTAGTVTYLA